MSNCTGGIAKPRTSTLCLILYQEYCHQHSPSGKTQTCNTKIQKSIIMYILMLCREFAGSLIGGLLTNYLSLPQSYVILAEIFLAEVSLALAIYTSCTPCPQALTIGPCL